MCVRSQSIVGRGRILPARRSKCRRPPEQLEIPFLVWMSQGFKDSRGLSEADIIPAETFPHDFPFHSVMGFFGMRSDIYKPQYDIFNLNQ